MAAALGAHTLNIDSQTCPVYTLEMWMGQLIFESSELHEILSRLDQLAPSWQLNGSNHAIMRTQLILASSVSSMRPGSQTIWIIIKNKEEAMLTKLSMEFLCFGEAEWEKGSRFSGIFTGRRQPVLAEGWYFKE